MKKLAIISAATAMLALAIPAAATAQSQYGYNNSQVRNVQCERENAKQKKTGAVVGAIAGGLLGGALGNEIHDNSSDRNVGRYNRGGRYNVNRGRNYGRGYGRRGNYRRGRDSNDGEVIVGALLGAVIGGVAGSAIADDSSSNCRVAGPSNPQGTYGANNSIPQRTDGLYGGPEVMNGSNYPNTPARTYPTSGNSYPNTGSTYPTRTTTRTTYPARTTTRTTYPAPQTPPREECRTVYQETRLPDGRTESNPVTACRQGTNGEWKVVQAGDVSTSSDPYRY